MSNDYEELFHFTGTITACTEGMGGRFRITTFEEPRAFYSRTALEVGKRMILHICGRNVWKTEEL